MNGTAAAAYAAQRTAARIPETFTAPQHISDAYTPSPLSTPSRWWRLSCRGSGSRGCWSRSEDCSTSCRGESERGVRWEAPGMIVRAGVKTCTPVICCLPFIPIGSSHDDGLGVHGLGLRSGQRKSVRKNEGVHVQKGCLSWGLGCEAPLLSRAPGAVPAARVASASRGRPMGPRLGRAARRGCRRRVVSPTTGVLHRRPPALDWFKR
jgi:hypothetical protein